MFELPNLPYELNALEPFIDAQTMEIHHGKHHAAYVKKLNEALEAKKDLQSKSIEEILQSLDSLPEEVRTKVRNNGGGHYNHSFFWPLMKQNGGGEPAGDLAQAINDAFGNFADFKIKFSEAAANHFGSGWAWLTFEDGKLTISTTPNQDSPVMRGIKPILGLDVWEHAYYLKYQNKRPDYINAWWNVVNWEQAEENYANAK
ncbi:MAG: superoxide dismutase [Candidatus Doudnabacteria bacterium RIFCSPHIGHO2_02_FULL_46_11]|uniref:Superoxide dismutase n=1 Tax=Candidatus Doudnabacteria bacterium RIFCSPHIGHO2_02_FULL_46_11 TaxID=1817832 RepID=A0A1F5P9K8_9BACT|nr:MAG: superoxide dismutase [Candidatus Doudnabacteria bacterium RIFCSPHIGHO2_02_FULL_46_11]